MSQMIPMPQIVQIDQQLKIVQADRRVITAFAAVEGVGQATLKRLNQASSRVKGGWSQLWKLLTKQSQHRFIDTGLLSEKQYEAALKFHRNYSPDSYFELLESKNIEVILSGESEYPKLLAQIPDKPEVLFVKGNKSCLNSLTVAVVGTRKPTSYGQFVTQKIVEELCFLGCCIVSGFMYGVDALAHKTALSLGSRSIAVLGFGFDKFYPKYHEQLMEEFLAAGNVCISEFPPHSDSRPYMFPMRNRIVAGLSHSVVVTEAAAGSGSLITARCAGEYGRGICAVPGSITSLYSDGTRELHNAGAVMISCGADVLEDISDSLEPSLAVFERCYSHKTQLSPQLKQLKGKFSHSLKQELNHHLKQRQKPNLVTALLSSELEKKTYHELLSGPKAVDDLIGVLSVSVPDLLQLLTKLELIGLVKAQGEFWMVSYK